MSLFLSFYSIVQATVQDMSDIHVTGGRAHCQHQVAFFISIDPKISTSVAPPSNESTKHGLATGNYNYYFIHTVIRHKSENFDPSGRWKYLLQVYLATSGLSMYIVAAVANFNI